MENEENQIMKKKIMLLALALVMLVTPLFAIGGTSEDNSVGVGINFGNNTGVALRFGFGDFDVLANIGVSMFSLNSSGYGFGGDAAFNWNLYTIDGGRGLEFPLTIGAGLSTSVHFGDPTIFNLAVLFPFGIEYDFAQISDVPITVYFRLAPGFSLITANDLNVKFELGAYLGAIWTF